MHESKKVNERDPNLIFGIKMAWINGKAVFEEVEEEEIGEYVQIRPRVKKDTWKMFKGFVHIKDLQLKDALTDAIRLWLFDESYIEFECQYCFTELDKIYYTKHESGDHKHYCSMKCLERDEKRNEKTDEKE